eukprot:TRINITY_DN15030_c0_g1_i1.p1 TRINITY_DN15030_c0_g1~~TRINITY_DN15030_c0_g1_i1.p1  ORF type:complete len:148 (-),score=8.88 TRINITY_DN15030_c0_g1_i1:129-572(-)
MALCEFDMTIFNQEPLKRRGRLSKIEFSYNELNEALSRIPLEQIQSIFIHNKEANVLSINIKTDAYTVYTDNGGIKAKKPSECNTMKNNSAELNFHVTKRKRALSVTTPGDTFELIIALEDKEEAHKLALAINWLISIHKELNNITK